MKKKDDTAMENWYFRERLGEIQQKQNKELIKRKEKH